MLANNSSYAHLRGGLVSNKLQKSMLFLKILKMLDSETKWLGKNIHYF